MDHVLWLNGSVVTVLKPHTKEEKILRAKGYKLIAGVDEAGRGAWAGPVVAGAVILSVDFKPRIIRDSKMLSPKQRERMFVHITGGSISWAVAVASNQLVDKKGMGYVNRMVLQDAVNNLHVKPQAVLVDALKITVGKKSVKAIIRGDAKVLSIAAASIVAKVVRDELLRGWHRLYPAYEFHKHKGYGTARHHRLLKKHGPSPIHRMTWKPMSEVINNKYQKANKHQ